MGADRRDGRGTGTSRIAQVAKILRGKDKPSFTPHVDCGDNVVIINAEKVKTDRQQAHGQAVCPPFGLSGGIRLTTPAEYLKKNPEFIIEKAVKGMLAPHASGRRSDA